MSHFWGCVRLSPDPDIQDIYKKMRESMLFFKADAHVFFESDTVVLANDLLYTTPEASSLQGICRNERFILVGSCRLDNRAELAKKLGLDDSQTDYEYLLASFVTYGSDCVKHLLGDFSFAIWDTQEHKLFIAKDHLGIKPLFYYQDTDKFVFSTAIHTIKSVVVPKLNEQYIAKELKCFLPEVEETFFADIHRFRPAHYALVNTTNGMQEPVRYWELMPLDISAFKTTEERYAELRRLFTEAVLCRARTSKNVGVQLSGGLDSSAIASILARHIPKDRLHTYAFVLSDKTRPYSERGIDEQGTQQAMIEYSGLLPENHHKIEEFHFKDVFEEFERSNLIMGGHANSDCIWQDTLFKTAAENNVGFIMSGFPGDECVSNSGSRYYYDYIGNRDIKALFRMIVKNPLRGPKRILDYYIARQSGFYIKGYDKVQMSRSLLREDSPWHKLPPDGSYKFYPTFKALLKSQICRPHTCHRTESEGAYALSHGMETVYPLADIRLIAFVYSLPAEMFAPEPYSRAVFKNMCIGLLPERVRLQPKNSGAMTLAFAEYHMKKQFEELKDYKITDPLNMFCPVEKLRKNGDSVDNILALAYYSLDYHIKKYVS
jgi:asparagine synthase (glutamine-hydrolysing)